MVMAKRDFSVLDRANLKSILAEHKLTATGLVDPDNAKKLGLFAGVDALILGTITPKSQEVQVTAKIITTETAEVVGAAKATFRVDKNVEELMARATIQGKPGSVPQEDAPKVTKTFGDLRVELRSLHVVNGQSQLLTMTLANQNAKKSIWVAFHGFGGATIKGSITDPVGDQSPNPREISGIPSVGFNEYTPGPKFSPATEIKPGESIPVTVKFSPLNPKQPLPGTYTLQMEFCVGHDFDTAFAAFTTHNLIAKMDLE